VRSNTLRVRLKEVAALRQTARVSGGRSTSGKSVKAVEAGVGGACPAERRGLERDRTAVELGEIGDDREAEA
jgi:hypothetical protein